MGIHLKSLRDNTCIAPQQWYVCDSPHFRGCCSNNACDAGGCLDTSTTAVEQATAIGSTTSGRSTYSKIPAATASQQPSQTAKGTSTNAPMPTSVTTRISNVPALASTTSTLTTASETRSPNATLTGSGNTQQPSSTPSNSHTEPTIIASVVAGVGVIVLAALLILLWTCLRRRKTRSKEMERFDIQNGSPTIHGTAHAGIEQAHANASHKKSKAEAVRGSMVWSLVSSLTTAAGIRDSEKKPRSPISPIHTPEDIVPYTDDLEGQKHPELAGPAQDVTAELPDTDYHGRRVELSADPERPLINSPKHNPDSPNRSEHAESSSSKRDKTFMGSNLNDTSRGKGGSMPHIMSWASYNEDAGPQR